MSIALDKNTATITVGETLDYSSFTVTATYSDDTDFSAALTAAMISDEDKALLSEVGVHQLTVNFMEHTTTLTVTVEALEMKRFRRGDDEYRI